MSLVRHQILPTTKNEPEILYQNQFVDVIKKINSDEQQKSKSKFQPLR